MATHYAKEACFSDQPRRNVLQKCVARFVNDGWVFCPIVTVIVAAVVSFKDTQQDLLRRRVAAAATTCACLKIHSGNPTSTKVILDQSPELNMNFLILADFGTISSPRETTAVIHCSITRRRVQFAMWKDTRQSWWFQQERSVPTDGPQSTQDIWSRLTLSTSEWPTFVWMRHRKLRLEE